MSCMVLLAHASSYSFVFGDGNALALLCHTATLANLNVERSSFDSKAHSLTSSSQRIVFAPPIHAYQNKIMLRLIYLIFHAISDSISTLALSLNTRSEVKLYSASVPEYSRRAPVAHTIPKQCRTRARTPPVPLCPSTSDAPTRHPCCRYEVLRALSGS